MQKEITVKNVRKSAASLLQAKMYIILSLSGIAFILLHEIYMREKAKKGDKIARSSMVVKTKYPRLK